MNDPVPDGICPLHVERRLMQHRWDRLTFLHWRFEPEAVARLLPPGVEVETFDGSAWVGLVPFYMEVAAGRGPALPWVGHFCETNVRTYARAADGTSGVWFFSLDAARLAAVVTARTTYRLPYYWSRMAIECSGDEITYTTRRRWPGPRSLSSGAVTSRVRVRVGAPYAADELAPLDHFLTARWRLYSHTRTGLRYGWAEHDPWPLYRAEALEVDDRLVAAAGLTVPDEAPLVHFSPGVGVRIGFPHGLVVTR
ncbi:MAG: DUF2071 domain-containing protein [Acidimicrobiales bacterium]